MVRLHGGVSRAHIHEEPVKYAEEDDFLTLAEAHSWIMLYPFGQAGATWWDEVGMANVHGLVRTVKRTYNVDDDRVWMCGFSDGASAAFAHAMVDPVDYAAFVALNGHIGVGSLDGDLPLYARNLVNSPVYAITTKEDELYPSHKMRATIDMATRAGADIFYRELDGAHDFSYGPEELPRIARFLERHPRDPCPSLVVWEAGVPRYGRCHWFKIEQVVLEEPASWHVDHNVAIVNDRITIGFVRDDSHDGEGVKVGTVAEKTAAEGMGLKPGDIIVKGNDMAIKDMDDLVKYKATLARGGDFSLTVLREGGSLALHGTLPEVANYYVFKREIPSGIIKASLSANRVDVESSRVGAFTVYVDPDVVNLGDNLVITWNGEVIHDDVVEPDIEFMLRHFLENRDRKQIYVAGIYAEKPALEQD
jgi:hypothetical protein